MTPRVAFLLGGVQKGGTTALAAAIAAHPRVALPRAKEAHVFDDPGFDEGWDAADVDRRFAAHIDAAGWADPGVLVGDATPITAFHPRLVARVARYNPAMRWILLLREPVDRAISQWHMERARGAEHWPMWAAFLLERQRLRGREDDFSDGSPLRHHSYLARGRYRRQREALLAAFPRGQLLVLRTEWLASRPTEVLRRVWAHLGIEAPAGEGSVPRAFEGDYRMPAPWHLARWIARRALRRDNPWAVIDEECPP